RLTAHALVLAPGPRMARTVRRCLLLGHVWRARCVGVMPARTTPAVDLARFLSPLSEQIADLCAGHCVLLRGQLQVHVQVAMSRRITWTWTATGSVDVSVYCSRPSAIGHQP